MRLTSVSLFAGFIFLLGVSVSPGHAQPTSDEVTFDVSAPPSGALSQGELEAIASTIRRLERHPTAEGADKARITLVQWLQQSPDVTVSICPEIASPFTANEIPTLRRALQQHLLSTAAYTLENPDADDPVAAKMSGLNGALRVYEAGRQRSSGRQRQEKGGVESIEQILELRENGELNAFVERALERCSDTE